MAHVDRLLELLEQIAGKYGTQLHDYVTGKNCDLGQAICRELYGSDWMNSPRFHADEDRGEIDEKWVPDEAVAAAEKMLAELPEWAKEAKSGGEKK